MTTKRKDREHEAITLLKDAPSSDKAIILWYCRWRVWLLKFYQGRLVRRAAYSLPYIVFLFIKHHRHLF